MYTLFFNRLLFVTFKPQTWVNFIGILFRRPKPSSACFWNRRKVIHPSSSSNYPGSGSRGPDFPRCSGQPRNIVPSACPGSSPGGTCLEHLISKGETPDSLWRKPNWVARGHNTLSKAHDHRWDGTAPLLPPILLQFPPRSGTRDPKLLHLLYLG